MKSVQKNLLASFLMLIISFTATYSQNRLIGSTPSHGGSIFEMNDDGSDPKQLIDMSYGYEPNSTLSLIDSKLWGTTLSGGKYGYGIIFNMELDGSNFKTVHDFKLKVGADLQPGGYLIEVNGKIWGTTRFGGIYNSQDFSFSGMIYSIEKDGSNFTVIHNFDGENGQDPNEGLIKINDKIWGVTRSGGDSDLGTIFSIKTDGSDFTTVFDFNSTTGELPNGHLIVSNNKFWGLTSAGGNNGFGTVFTLEIDGTGFKKVYDFNSQNGNTPRGSLTAFNGNLWGTCETSGNSRIIFAIDPESGTYKKMIEAINVPYKDLIGFEGKLWGIGIYGLFSYDISSLEIQIFNSGYRKGQLLVYNNKMYGAGIDDGAFSRGSIYSINPSDVSKKELYSFGRPEGFDMLGGFIKSNDRIWGMTARGGNYNAGVIFSMSLDNSDYTIVHHFEPSNGAYPQGNLYEYNGKFWGMTTLGGAGWGCIFNLNTDGTNYTKVLEFDQVNGRFPIGNLVEYNGKIWGMTPEGGLGAKGVLFSINEDGSEFNIVYDFSWGSYGYGPRGSLVKFDGKLWGITYGDATIFTVEENEMTRVFNFNAESGYGPRGDLLICEDKLVGLAAYGGKYDFGTLYALNTKDFTVTTIHDFGYDWFVSDKTIDGISPTRTPTFYNNRIWGFTSYGGTSYYDGTVFTINLDGSDFKKIYDFDGSIGGTPSRGNLLIVDTSPPSLLSETYIRVDENYTGSFYNSLANEDVFYSLGTNNDEEYFTLFEGKMGFTSPPDFENPIDKNRDNVYVVEIILKDNSDLITRNELLIEVIDIDETALKLSKIELLSVYPNPATKSATIIFGDLKERKVRVMDESGRIIWFDSRVNSKSIELPVDQFPKGLFIVKIECNNQIETVKLFIE